MSLLRFASLILTLAALNFSAAAFALEFDTTEQDDQPLTYILASGLFSDKKSGDAFTDVKKFDEVMAREIKKSNNLVIYMTSEGGSLESSSPLAKRIFHWSTVYAEARKKPLIVALMIECSSACTFFSSALNKLHNPKNLVFLVPRDTTMVMHGPINLDTGQEMERKEDFERFLKIGMKAYVENGVSEKWLRANTKVFTSTRGKAFTALDLCREKSGVIPPIACVRDHNAVSQRISEIIKQIRA